MINLPTEWLKALAKQKEENDKRTKHQCEWWDAPFQNRYYCETNASVTYSGFWWCVKHAKLVKEGKRWG